MNKLDTNFTNDNNINVDTINTNDNCLDSSRETTVPDTAKTPTSDPRCIVGYLPLSGGRHPRYAQTDKIIADPPPNGKYAEVFNKSIAAVQMEKITANKICGILDESGIHYEAVASATKVRLYFHDIGFQGHYHGSLFCGINAEVAGSGGYLPHLEGCTQVIHTDDSYDPLPPWLGPEKDCSPLHSGILLTDERKWTKYLKKIYCFYREQKGINPQEAHAITFETAKILNRYFRDKPYNDQRLENSLNIMDLEFDLDNFYSVSTDSKGNKISTFERELFAEFLIKRYYLTNIDYSPYRYSSGVYVPISDKDCESLIMKYIKDTTTSKRKEIVQTIFSLLGIYADQTTAEADQYYEMKHRCKPELVAFNNCIYDVQTDTTLDFSPDIIITNRIPFDYVDFGKLEADEKWKKAKETVDGWLDSFSGCNSEKRAVLEEVAGLAMYQRNEGLRRHHTILIGKKECGTSTYIHMVEDLVGDKNCSHVPLRNFCNPNNRFSSSSLVHALINTYGDISKSGIQETEQIKNICTGDSINVEKKMQQEIGLTWTGKMIFAGNYFPSIYDPALISRFEFIPCTSDYSTTSKDNQPDLRSKMSTNKKCMEYWCYLAIQGLKRFIHNNYKHTYCKEIEQYRAREAEMVDPVESYISSLSDADIEGHETNDIHNGCIDYCGETLGLSENSTMHYTKNRITMKLKNRGFYTTRKSVNNKKVQIYTKIK